MDSNGGSKTVQTPPPPVKRTRRPQFGSRTEKDKHQPSTECGHMIFLGPADSGKSRTINSLFGHRNISPPRGHVGTSEILEFTAENLRIVDTPGLGFNLDTELDAKIIASLKKYMDMDFYLRRSIPHVVVLVTRFDDPTLDDRINHPFVKTLKVINLLNRRLFSQEYCNIIVVLTHFMNERKNVRDNPTPRTHIVRDLVRKYLNKSCHIIFGENDAESWGLPQNNLGHQLPTGDIYPGNLVELLWDVIGRSGLTATLFQSRGTVSIRLTKSISLVSTENSRFKKSVAAVNWSCGNLPLSI